MPGSLSRQHSCVLPAVCRADLTAYVELAAHPRSRITEVQLSWENDKWSRKSWLAPLTVVAAVGVAAPAMADNP
jgi:hypothetical protein